MRIESSNIKSNPTATSILIHIMIVVFAPVLSTLLAIKVIGNSAFSDVPGFMENFIGFNTLLILLLSGAAYFITRRKKSVVAVEFFDNLQVTEIFYKTAYKNTLRKLVIPYKNLHYEIWIKTSNDSHITTGKIDNNDLIAEKTIIFLSNAEHMAQISTGGVFWTKQGGKLKMIMDKIDEITTQQKS